MKVYVLETGAYENRGIAGVFTSLDTAKAAVTDGEGWKEHEGWWSWSGREGFSGDCADITEFDLQT